MLELTPIGGLLCVLVMAGLLIVEGLMAFFLLLEILAKRYGEEISDNLYMTPDVDALVHASVAIESESADTK